MADKGLKNCGASFVSRKVLKRLSGAEQGTIVAIFNRSFIVETEGKFIIAIGTNDLPLSPRSLSLPDDVYAFIKPRIFLGLPVLCSNRAIYMSDINLCISVKEAHQFNPKLNLRGNLLPRMKVIKNLIAAFQWVDKEKNNVEWRCSPLSGYFLSRIPFLFDPTVKESQEANFSRAGMDLFLNLKNDLWEILDCLLYGMTEYSYRYIFNSVRRIIGMGPGLTPSGDDFLAGMICVSITLAQNWPEISDFAENVARIILEESIGKTTTVSISMIEDAANGEMSEPAVNFICSVLLKDNIEQIKYFTKEVTSMGGSSGEDLLNGIATGIFFFHRDKRIYRPVWAKGI